MTWWPRLGVLHRDRIVTYLLIAAAATSFVLCGAAAGRFVVAGLLAVIAGVVAVVVDGSAGAAAVLVAALTFDWLVSVGDAQTWWTLPAAALLTLVWSGCILAGSGPHEARLSPLLVRAWAMRTASLVAGVSLVAAAALSLIGVGQVHTPLIAVIALLATTAGVFAVSVRWFGTR